MKVHHVNLGTFRPFGRSLVNGVGWVFQPGRLVCHSLVLETASGLVLVDAGLGTADLADPAGRLGRVFLAAARPDLEPAETARARVAALGYDPEDVRDVLLTHLDVDHAGGLGDFPRARVHVLATEHAAAMRRPGFWDRRRYRPCQWSHDPDWVLYDASGDSWEGFQGVRALEGLPPEILLVPLPGHSRGHAGFAVRGERGWILHAGDAFICHSQLHPERPTCPRALAVFERLITAEAVPHRQNLERIREVVRDRGAEIDVVCTHDPATFDPRSCPS